MPIDLVSRRAKLNDLILSDTCEIWRDAEGAGDDQVGAGGSIIGPDPDSTLVTTSPCSLKLDLRPTDSIEGGRPVVVKLYRLLLPIPLPAGEVKDGDMIRMTVCGHDPSLVGKQLRVAEVIYGTHVLFRRVRCELRERPSDRP